jgi:hypothetical protein
MTQYTVSFHVNWDESSAEFLDSIRVQTPDELGEWGCIKGVTESDCADYHVVFNQPRSDFDESNCLFFSAEPPVSSMYQQPDSVDYAATFPIECNYKPQRWWIKKTYDQLIALEPPVKTKPLSWITTDKGKHTSELRRGIRSLMRRIGIGDRHRDEVPLFNLAPLDGHVLRMDFYDRMINAYPELLDLYGRGDFYGAHYKGEIDDKWTGLEPYRYSLAIENYKGENYFSEKISDALLSWCMPIYWGCTNLLQFLPEESYVWIDIEDPDAPERVAEIVQSKRRERNLGAIAEARRRILDRYQIWPTVERAILNLEEPNPD